MPHVEQQQAVRDESLDRWARPARVRSIELGELRLSYVPDGLAQISPSGWLPQATAEFWAERPHLLDADGYLVGGLGGLLIENGDRAMLVDAGLGPVTIPGHRTGRLLGVLAGGAFPQSLAALGRAPERIEAVAFSHLHDDHVGWALRDELAHAELVVAEPEWAFWREYLPPPVVAAMRARLRVVRDGEEIFPGVRVLASPGHTPGHTGYLITSGDARLVAFGDGLHSPVQIGHPDWLAGGDMDPALAVRSRLRIVDELLVPGTLGFGIHFADVPFGRVVSSPDGEEWLPVGD